jgi:hypothetical protein
MSGSVDLAALAREVQDLNSSLVSLRARTNAKLRQFSGRPATIPLPRSLPSITDETMILFVKSNPNVSVTSSSDSDAIALWSARNALDPDTPSCFCSVNSPDQFLRVDLPSEVTLTGYAIRSSAFCSGSAHPRNWVLESSTDGSAWTELHRRSDNADLNGCLRLFLYTFHGQSRARSVRIRQTGPNHCGNNVFSFSYFDLFLQRGKRHEFTFTGNFWQGIFNALHGRGKIRDQVTVTASSVAVGSDRCPNCVSPDPWHVLELGTDSCFFSAERPGQWIAVEFKTVKVWPRSYAIRTHTTGNAVGQNHPRSWVFEGLDGSDWVTLDERHDDTALSNWSTSASFTITNPIECSAVRLRSIGPNRAGNACLAMGSFEIFGTLFIPADVKS